MDAIEQLQQGLIEREYATYVGIFVIITVVIAVLSFIIISQNKKISQLQKPKYGFLGKPLAVVLAIGLLVGSYGIIFYANRNSTNVSDVSADRQITAQITYQALGNKNYIFKLVPDINGQPWGKDPENQFDVYWTFTGASVDSEVELNLSQNNPGGTVVTLDPGKYAVKAVIFFDSLQYEKDIDVTIAK